MPTMPTTRLSRRALFRASLALAGSAAAGAVLAACGEAAAPTVAPAAPTVAPTTAAAPAATTAPTAGGAATTAPAPATMGAMATTAPAATGATGTTGTANVAVPTVAMGGGKTIPELRVLVAANIEDGWDPLFGSSNVRNRSNYSVFDYLVRVDYSSPTFKLAPMLATEWRRVDERTVEFTLRQGATWQDGAPVTADDVVFTFNRIIQNKDAKYPQANTTYFPIASVAKVDERTVRFTGLATDPIFERRFASPGAQIIPQRYFERVGAAEFAAKPIGSGPYRVVEFTPGDRAVYEAHRGYWGGAPAANRLTMRVVPEVAARVAAITNGEAEIITNVPPDQVMPLSTRRNLAVKGQPLTNFHVLYYNQKAKGFERNEVRQAMSYAIDRKSLVENIWLGNAQITRGFQFAGEDLHNASRPLYEYNVDRAKMLLTQGGYAGEEIQYVASSPNYYTNEREAGEAIVAMWKQAGINARLNLVELAAKTRAVTNGGHAYTVSATSFIGDQEGYLWQPFGPNSNPQKNGWWTPTGPFNMLGETVRTALDRQTRYDALQRMLDITDAEPPGTVLYQPKELYAVANTVEWEPYTYYYFDLRPYNFRVK